MGQDIHVACIRKFSVHIHLHVHVSQELNMLSSSNYSLSLLMSTESCLKFRTTRDTCTCQEWDGCNIMGGGGGG